MGCHRTPFATGKERVAWLCGVSLASAIDYEYAPGACQRGIYFLRRTAEQIDVDAFVLRFWVYAEAVLCSSVR